MIAYVDRLKAATTEHLIALVAAGLSGRRAPAAVSARDANAELARRLRELVPLLEEMRQNCADWDEDGGFREELDRAIAIVKGGEEKR